MGNLVTCSFAFKEGFNTSYQLNKSAGNETTDIYLKNIFVSLVSARNKNPEDTFAICVNEPLPSKWAEIFNSQGILVKEIPFDTFLVSREFSWALAYYKLCVMNALTREDYDRIILMDADTFTTQSYEDLWKECDFGVLLYPLGHSFSHLDRDAIRKDFVKLYPEEAKSLDIVHYGGEFIAGNRRDLRTYLDVCERVFGRISNINFDVAKNAGDETIWSIAAALCSGNLQIIAATSYIFRFWTEEFYLVSTVTVSNPVSIWHLPQEKRSGFLRLYRYYERHNAFPCAAKTAKMFGIIKAKRPFDYYTFENKVRRKLKLDK